MPLEFALRPRFDLNRPPKRRRHSGFELPPYALPVAAYWLAIGGAAFWLLSSRVTEASSDAPQNRSAESPRITDAASNDTLASWRAGAELGAAAVPTQRALEPAPVATLRDEEPRREPAMDADPRGATALNRAFASLPETPRLPRSDGVAPQQPAPQRPAPEPPAPRELVQEPPARDDEIPSRALVAETARREAPSAALPSCEDAADTANQIIDLGGSRGAPDLTRGAFAAVLENGSYLTPCAIPARTALEVCAAVRDGQVVGVTVTTEPRDPAISACVRRAVAALRFPRNSRLDVTHTRFESSR